MCGLVRRLREVVSTDSLRLFYVGQIQSIKAYGILLWGSSCGAQGVFVLQKRILRCILGLHPRDSCGLVFGQLGILTVLSLYFSTLVTFVKKNPSLFEQNRNRYAENMMTVTRHRNIETTYYRAIKAYRMLPASLQKQGNINNITLVAPKMLLFF